MSSKNNNNNNNSSSNMIADYLSMILTDLIVPENKSSSSQPAYSRTLFDVLSHPSSDLKIDMQETDEMITITVELPGFNKENIKIDFFNNQLSIKAEKIKPSSAFVLNEIKYGLFERKITLPLCITVKDTVSTKYENGNLIIMINKTIEESNRFSINLR